jgi:hypothetical protein
MRRPLLLFTAVATALAVSSDASGFGRGRFRCQSNPCDCVTFKYHLYICTNGQWIDEYSSKSRSDVDRAADRVFNCNGSNPGVPRSICRITLEAVHPASTLASSAVPVYWYIWICDDDQKWHSHGESKSEAIATRVAKSYCERDCDTNQDPSCKECCYRIYVTGGTVKMPEEGDPCCVPRLSPKK